MKTIPPSSQKQKTPGFAWNFCKQWASCTALAYLALLPYFYEVYDLENRRALNYGRDSYWAILLAVATCGLILFTTFRLADAFANRFRKLRPVSDLAIAGITYFIVVRSLFGLLLRGSLLPAPISSWVTSGLGKSLYYGLVPALLAIFLRSRRIRRIADSVGTMLIPALAYGSGVFLFFTPAQELSENELESSCRAFADSRRESDGDTSSLSDILIFFYDEWEYDRAFPGGQLLADLTNLQAFADTATTYHCAYSLGSSTMTSLPRFLFQNNPPFVGQTYSDISRFLLSGQPPQGPSLYDEIPSSHFKVFLGAGFDYNTMLGSRIQYVGRYDTEAGWRNFRRQFVMLMRTQIDFLRYFIKSWSHMPDRVHQVFFQAQKTMPPDVEWLLNQASPPLAGIFHFCFPHFPYAWNRDGVKTTDPRQLEFLVSSAAPHTLEGYLDNMRYADTLVGRHMEILKRRNRFDQALIIITSDHAWKYDPSRAFPDHIGEDADKWSPMKHVVCWIKLPRQTQGSNSYDPFSLLEIQQLIAGCASPSPRDPAPVFSSPHMTAP